MKVTPWCLAALAPIAAAGCSGTFLGHFAVLALTLGIFFGTLSLGRHRVEVGPAAEASGDAAGTAATTVTAVTDGSSLPG